MSTISRTPHILSVGTAVPPVSFTQELAGRMLAAKTAKAQRFFQHKHIHTRHLLLPDGVATGEILREETPADLRKKFLKHAPLLIAEATRKALKKASLSLQDVDFLACVTSTGFAVPGLSALTVAELGMKPSTQRLDIVGMGCNAGLNGLSSVAQWCASHPEKVGLLICCELCSCLYTLDDSENAALVNSLFGDGVAVAVIRNTEGTDAHQPRILGFASHMIPESLPLLRFDFEKEKSRYSFYVDKKTPETLGREIQQPLVQLLKQTGLHREQIRHWIVHSGGAAILDALEKQIGLAPKDLRHTRSVLRDYGNVSSGSFLFSYERLLAEGVVKPQDYGIMVTMGPGLTIEMAAVQW